MRAWVTAYIALGANLGDARQSIRQAVTAIGALPDCRVKKTSSFYRTAPLETLAGHAPGGDYINAVVEIQTQLSAQVLLQHLQRTEQAAGRARPYMNAPRTLDLDLLLYGDSHIDSPELVVPHPRMWQRAFVLLPLHEIASDIVGKDALDAVQGQVISKL